MFWTSFLAAIGAIGTAIVATCGYFLARKNFSVVADRHDRESVSVVFKKFRADNYLIYPSFIIYNNASVALLLENISLKIHTENMGWYAQVNGLHNGYNKPMAEWTQRGLKKQWGNSKEVYGITEWTEQDSSEFHAIILKPKESAEISIEYLTSKDMDKNFNIGAITARLCYNGAKSRNYDLVIPDTIDSRKLISDHQAKHDNGESCPV